MSSMVIKRYLVFAQGPERMQVQWLNGQGKKKGKDLIAEPVKVASSKPICGPCSWTAPKPVEPRQAIERN